MALENSSVWVKDDLFNQVSGKCLDCIQWLSSISNLLVYTLLGEFLQLYV